MKNVTIDLTIDLEELAFSLPLNDYETAFELIKTIDLRFADYEFTKLCQDYFNEEIKKEDEFITEDEQKYND